MQGASFRLFLIYKKLYEVTYLEGSQLGIQ